MGKAQYLLQRDVGAEEADIQSKAGQRGLWSKIGMGVGGALAIGLTGGAAAPIVAAAMAGGGTFLGGKIGDFLAKQKYGKIEGEGKFLSGQRAGVVRKIGEDITAGSLKAGLGAGMTALGAGVKLGKGGLSLSAPGIGAKVSGEGVTQTAGFKIGDIFKRRVVEGAPAATYGEGLLGRVGKAIDIKGSGLARGAQKLQSNIVDAELAKKLSLADPLPSAYHPSGINMDELMAKYPMERTPVSWEGTSDIISGEDDWAGTLIKDDEGMIMGRYDEFGNEIFNDPRDILQQRLDPNYVSEFADQGIAADMSTFSETPQITTLTEGAEIPGGYTSIRRKIPGTSVSGDTPYALADQTSTTSELADASKSVLWNQQDTSLGDNISGATSYQDLTSLPFGTQDSIDELIAKRSMPGTSFSPRLSGQGDAFDLVDSIYKPGEDWRDMPWSERLFGDNYGK